MIKIANKKSITEINELRDKGLYNAPFSVLEAMGKVDVGGDHSEIEEKIQEIELNNALATVNTYQMLDKIKQELETEQAKNLVEIYKMFGGK